MILCLWIKPYLFGGSAPTPPPTPTPEVVVSSVGGGGYDPKTGYRPYTKRVEDIEEIARKEIRRERRQNKKKVYEIVQTRKGPVAKRVASAPKELKSYSRPRDIFSEDRVLFIPPEVVEAKSRALGRIEDDLRRAREKKAKAEERQRVLRARIEADLTERRNALRREREHQLGLALEARRKAEEVIQKKRKEQQDLEDEIAIILLLGD